MSLDPAVRSRIESLLAANPVVLFMKGNPRAPQCGFSSKAISALDATGVAYMHVDVLSDGEIREGIKAYGDWPTIPQLYIAGELVGGSDIILQMASSGELHTALGVPAPDRTPPDIEITAAAADMLGKAIALRAKVLRCRSRSTTVTTPACNLLRTMKARLRANPAASARSSTFPARSVRVACASTGPTTNAARAW
jgi:Grx4 family monothiol glutaredoxin